MQVSSTPMITLAMPTEVAGKIHNMIDCPTHKSPRLNLIFILVLLGCADPPSPDPAPEADTSPPSVAAVTPQVESTPGSTVSPPDFASISDIPTLKRTFYQYLYPMVVSENDRIRVQRRRLQELNLRHGAGDLSARDIAWLTQLSLEYRIGLEGGPITTEHLGKLLHRVDIIPAALALAQAAIESGWGRSRFARLGNNIYGEWCFTPGCGIVPQRRNPGAVHEIVAFETPAGSIRSYLRNLNTHRAYADWRILRQQQRQAGTRLSAHDLAAGLTAYSELGEEYVRRVRAVIRQNAALLSQIEASP